ncbi:MAG TPA: FKBP-type peptidyl-prolyl cis-trans isomerase [Anaerolineales bacterium]|nr:FKBP-type peptidyl-prolyl cis-trans isomerase [Anaerolineales bacterium]
MTKAALREQRRSQRIARRNRQRAIIGVIVILAVALIAFFVYRDYSSRAQTQSGAYPIGKLDATPPALSANAVTTASGLQYEDLQVGTGATAQRGNTATVNYTGWLTDGTKFDSSIDRGQTFDFTIGAGGVIAGWDEGVQGMLVGGTRLLVIPPTLGYGTNGSPPTIPGNATLIFEVQLVSIK